MSRGLDVEALHQPFQQGHVETDCAEVSEKLGKSLPTRTSKAKPKPKPSTKAKRIQKGSTVRIPPKAQPDDFYDEGNANWVSSMDESCDAVAKVTKVLAYDRVRLDVDEGEFVWAVEWLVPQAD